MPLTPNARREIEQILAEENFSGKIILHCNRSRVVEIDLHRRIRPVPDDQEVVPLVEVARRSSA